MNIMQYDRRMTEVVSAIFVAMKVFLPASKNFCDQESILIVFQDSFVGKQQALMQY